MAETGRPTKKTPEILNQICEQIANSSKGLREIAASVGITRPTLLDWLKNDKDFSAQYAHAKALQADFLAEEMLTIADDGTNDTISTEAGEFPNHEWIARAKLRIDARKFLMGKLAPKKYGDKIDITTDGKAINAPIIKLANLD